MMRLVAHLDWNRFGRRIWIISSGDTLSETKALAFEKSIGTGEVSVASTGSQSQGQARSSHSPTIGSSGSCESLAREGSTNPI